MITKLTRNKSPCTSLGRKPHCSLALGFQCFCGGVCSVRAEGPKPEAEIYTVLVSWQDGIAVRLQAGMGSVSPAFSLSGRQTVGSPSINNLAARQEPPIQGGSLGVYRNDPGWQHNVVKGSSVSSYPAPVPCFAEDRRTPAHKRGMNILPPSRSQSGQIPPPELPCPTAPYPIGAKLRLGYPLPTSLAPQVGVIKVKTAQYRGLPCGHLSAYGGASAAGIIPNLLALNARRPAPWHRSHEML
jgi:hypothetical protein